VKVRSWKYGFADDTAPLVAYLVAGFLVLGILLSALAVWLWG
jgi:hypothetical protein